MTHFFCACSGRPTASLHTHRKTTLDQTNTKTQYHLTTTSQLSKLPGHLSRGRKHCWLGTRNSWHSNTQQRLRRTACQKRREIIRSLCVRFATENTDWGYGRIQGVLANVGYKLSRTAVATRKRKSLKISSKAARSPHRLTAFSSKNSLGENLQLSEKGGTWAPCFIWHTWEDTGVGMENSMLFANALRERGVRFELHIYEKRGHGIGLGDSNGKNPMHRWTADCLAWLSERQFVREPSASGND